MRAPEDRTAASGFIELNYSVLQMHDPAGAMNPQVANSHQHNQ
jgi:hypothetical protein